MNSIKTNLKRILQEKNKTKSVQEIMKKYESKVNGSLLPSEYELIVHLMYRQEEGVNDVDKILRRIDEIIVAE